MTPAAHHLAATVLARAGLTPPTTPKATDQVAALETIIGALTAALDKIEADARATALAAKALSRHWPVWGQA